MGSWTDTADELKAMWAAGATVGEVEAAAAAALDRLMTDADRENDEK